MVGILEDDFGILQKFRTYFKAADVIFEQFLGGFDWTHQSHYRTVPRSGVSNEARHN